MGIAPSNIDQTQRFGFPIGLTVYEKSLDVPLAMFDGSNDMIYTTQHGLQFLHWHPDSYHFVYEQSSIFRPFLGSVCGGSVPLLDSADTPATQIEWVDATRFLYAKGSLDPLAAPRELRLGQLDGTSILIGPFNGESAQYVFNVGKAPFGQDQGRLSQARPSLSLPSSRKISPNPWETQ